MRTRAVCGYTMIEVLVALLVLALGLIGGAAMQLEALRTRHQSALLSRAVQLASGMADAMRVNAGQMGRADADNPYLNQYYDAAVEAAPAAPTLCFAGSVCSDAQLARFDLYELKRQVKAALPGGRLAICRDENLWDAGRKILRWSCSGAATAPVVIKLGWLGKPADGSPLEDATRPSAPSVALTLTGAAR